MTLADGPAPVLKKFRTRGQRFARKSLLALASCPLLLAQRTMTKSSVPPNAPEVDHLKLEILKDLSASFEEITRKAGNSVVQIFAHTYRPEGSGSDRGLVTTGSSTASGIIVSSDGFILTNAHAIRGAHNVHVLMIVDDSTKRLRGMRDRDRAMPARIVGVDAESDLALIKVDRTNLPYLTFGNSDTLRQGELVLALGNPLGLENSVSLGVVSAVGRQLTPDDPRVYIQTDTPINPGSSGGPLLDADGRVVGINTFILTQSGGSEGLGFAIPSSIAQQVFVQLKTLGRVRRSQLGVIAQTVSPIMVAGLDLEANHGVIVSDVDPDGPAASAGLKQDDIITAVNDTPIFAVSELEARIYSQPPGSTVKLLVRRDTERLEIAVRTEEQPDELQTLADGLDPVNSSIPQLGVVGLDITGPVLKLMPDLRRPQGVVVAKRSPEAQYSGPALEVDDAIYEINRQVITNVAAARKALDDCGREMP